MIHGVELVGIVNITPDSFSDAGLFMEPERALDRARALIDDGADIIELGGDSTRPGSSCCGVQEEWRRISGVIRKLAVDTRIAVDTHHAEVARRALTEGAVMINDIGGARDPLMLKAVADGGCKFVVMHSCCSAPHNFEAAQSGDIVRTVKEYLLQRAAAVQSAGVSKSNIILDPGMGAFLGVDVALTWEVLSRLEELTKLGFPMMLGISRKGFLKQTGEREASERDALSAHIAGLVVRKLDFKGISYLRVHNVGIHRIFLQKARLC